jgi:hypothetical protein
LPNVCGGFLAAFRRVFASQNAPFVNRTNVIRGRATRVREPAAGHQNARI